MKEPSPREELLKLFAPGEKLSMRDVFFRQTERNIRAVQQALYTLDKRGAIRQAGKRMEKWGKESVLYELTGNPGTAPDRFQGSFIQTVCDLVQPDEWVTVAIMRGRIAGCDARRVSRALFDLAKRGRLEQDGKVGEAMRYRRPGAKQQDAVQTAPVLVPDALPFLALYTPSLPAFRIKGTRRVFNLTGRDDDEREAV